MTPAVFDCMVLLQAAANPSGPSGDCVAEVESGRARLYLSDATFDELADVVNRPKVRKRFRGLTDESVAAFLRRVRRIAVFVAEVSPVVTLTRDPRDERYLNLAVAAGATVVVSRDNDLLDLMTGTDSDAVKFRTDHPEIAVLDPATFLRTLRPTPDA